MKRPCPNSECSSQNPDPKARRIVRKGRYFRSSDGQWIQRYQCFVCRRLFSSATFSVHFRQKKRRINYRLQLLMNSGVSQRRAAILLRVNRKTVVRKFRFLAHHARLEHASWLRTLSKNPLSEVQFDDLETSEHSKCKPL